MLLAHIFTGARDASSLQVGETLTSVGGDTVKVVAGPGGETQLLASSGARANFVYKDLRNTCGFAPATVLHVIDAVLVPDGLQQTVRSSAVVM